MGGSMSCGYLAASFREQTEPPPSHPHVRIRGDISFKPLYEVRDCAHHCFVAFSCDRQIERILKNSIE